MQTTHISFTAPDARIPDASKLLRPDQAAVMLAVINYVEALSAGREIGSFTMRTGDGNAAAASGTVTFATASGTTDTVINGVTFQTTTGTDAERATALAAAINASASAMVQNVVTATAVNGVVTIAADVKGKSGNWITLAVSGTGITASGNRLTGGSDDTSAMTVEF